MNGVPQEQNRSIKIASVLSLNLPTYPSCFECGFGDWDISAGYALSPRQCCCRAEWTSPVETRVLKAKNESQIN